MRLFEFHGRSGHSECGTWIAYIGIVFAMEKRRRPDREEHLN